jgi:hypothetical protein
MEFNIGESFFIRCGPRFNKPCGMLILNEKAIKRCDNFKYLGVNFKAGKKLIFNMEHAKLNFYRAFNAIYSKCHAVNSEITCVFLLQTICLRFLCMPLKLWLQTF